MASGPVLRYAISRHMHYNSVRVMACFLVHSNFNCDIICSGIVYKGQFHRLIESVSGRGAVFCVKAPFLHQSILMTPLEQIPSEGDARLKMTASWELVKLVDDPQMQEIK